MTDTPDLEALAPGTNGANLGLATTRALLNELAARFEVTAITGEGAAPVSFAPTGLPHLAEPGSPASAALAALARIAGLRADLEQDPTGRGRDLLDYVTATPAGRDEDLADSPTWDLVANVRELDRSQTHDAEHGQANERARWAMILTHPLGREVAEALAAGGNLNDEADAALAVVTALARNPYLVAPLVPLRALLLDARHRLDPTNLTTNHPRATAAALFDAALLVLAGDPILDGRTGPDPRFGR